MITHSFTWTGNSTSHWGGIPGEWAQDSLLKAIRAHRARDFDAAWAAYLQAFRARPNRALVPYCIGLLQIEREMGMSSIPFLLRACLTAPERPLFREALLYARLRSGRFANYERLLQESEDLHPHVNWSRWRTWLELCRQGCDPARLDLPSPSLVADADWLQAPDQPFAPARSSPRNRELGAELASALRQFEAGDYQGLLERISPLLALYPDWGEGHHLLGAAMAQLSRKDKALVALTRASELLPGRADVWDHLALLWKGFGDFEQAEGAFERSLALAPLRPESWNNAADIILEWQDYKTAHQYATLAMRLDPSLAPPIVNYGRALNGLGDLQEAQRVYTYLLEALPKHSLVLQYLGDIHMVRGDYPAAADLLQRAMEAQPDNEGAISSALFTWHYLGEVSQDDRFALARRYGELVARSAAPATRWPNERLTDKVLKVGFVSGDFGQHPVGQFFVAVAEALGAQPGLDLYGFPTTRRSDALNDRFQRLFPHWIPLLGLDDAEAAQRIGGEGIDLLIDLSGHTAGSRLGVFARRPAPVQLTWLGYFATTGLAAIDYLLAGPWDIPPDEERYFTEKIWRLPATRLCFSRPAAEVPVASLPALASGVITLGCFNKLVKLNDEVVALWASILRDCPQTRLFLKAGELGRDQVDDSIRRRFARHGVAGDRLILEGPSAFEDYLAAYQRVDLALDPFPYTGGTTSIQGLWMGVPFVTLAGRDLLSRQGESMLRALDLDDWVARDTQDYRDKVVAKLSHLDHLAQLRAGLRHRLEASPLMNAPLFASHLTQALRSMWRDYCLAIGYRPGDAGPDLPTADGAGPRLPGP